MQSFFPWCLIFRDKNRWPLESIYDMSIFWQVKQHNLVQIVGFLWSSLHSTWAVHVVTLIYCVIFIFFLNKCHYFFSHLKILDMDILPIPSLHDYLRASFSTGYSNNIPTGQMLVIRIFCLKKHVLFPSCQRTFWRQNLEERHCLEPC